jgi:hypothetical protein
MPPAKITFRIKGGPGFFKDAAKADIYWWEYWFDADGDDVMADDEIEMQWTNPFYAVVIPAAEEIPAFVNNGGYDWDSTWSPAYGLYWFWFIVNRPDNNPAEGLDSSNLGNYPNMVDVYSDNHGEAMVYLNGDWNLDPRLGKQRRLRHSDGRVGGHDRGRGLGRLPVLPEAHSDNLQQRYQGLAVGEAHLWAGPGAVPGRLH